MAIEESDTEELTTVIAEMRKIKLPTVAADVAAAQKELDILVCRRGKFICLIYFRMNQFPHTILVESNFKIRYVRLGDLDIHREKWRNFFEDPDQTPHSAASDLLEP